VETAIGRGLKILGFSDHTPMPYPEGYVSHVKMRMDQLEDYVDTVLALRKEYAREIDIRLGLEVEYYPAYFENLVRFTGQFPIEYYILGQHCLGNEIGDLDVFRQTSDPHTLQRYCDQTIEALKTGCFTYFAHPDVLHFTGDAAVYEEKMRKLCLEVKALQIPMEINFLGIWNHRHYPNAHFWEIAGEVGNTVIFGADAHQAEKVWNPAAEEKAMEIVRKNHLHLIETVDLVKPALN
jgi:histidinol-phosphatase (PHP family)